MKQVMQSLRSGETSVVDVPLPAVRPNTALVRTAVSLVSAGTERMVVDFAGKSLLGKARSRPDLVQQVFDKARREGILATVQAAFNRLDQPMTLGYSSSGQIVSLGDGLQGFYVGQRVACAGGNYAVHAEYAVVPRNLLISLPDEVDYEAAAFTTLGAIALHGFRLAEVGLGSRVAVIGLGLLGLLAVQLARAAGCQVLGVDIDPRRVEAATKLGVPAVLRPQVEEASSSLTHGRGFDGILICADTPSADPVELAGAIARDRARVIAVGAVGLKLPRKVYYEKELTFINSRSYGPGRYDPSYEEAGQDYPIGYVRWSEGRNMEAFVELLASQDVEVKSLVTHRFPIEEATKAYDLITGKKTAEDKTPFLAVLLTYDMGSDTQDKSYFEITPDPSAQEVDENVPVGASKATRAKTIPSRPTSGPIRLGVLGAGNFASAVMLPAICSLSHIQPVAVASGSGLTAHHAARRFGFEIVANNPAEVIGNETIQVIAILTRHHLHAIQVLSCLEAGKHVFCEKPLALTRPDLDRIESVLNNAESPAPLLLVGFNRRFAPMSQKLRDFWLDRREPLALNYRVNAGYLPPNHWVHDPVQGGGRILGEACHFIDLMTFLVGASPVSVQGQLLPHSGRYREDNAVLVLEFPDGSVGTLSYLASGDRSFSKERLEVYGSGRVAVLDDFRSLELVRDGKRNLIQSRLRQDKGHVEEWRSFIQAIRQGGPPPIPYEHIFGVSRATLAALEALRSGQRIKIPA
jgi:predicted dehydrogenase/NADPH:quinone reductase-like Zn-dependent oxidoreductase